MLGWWGCATGVRRAVGWRRCATGVRRKVVAAATAVGGGWRRLVMVVRGHSVCVEPTSTSVRGKRGFGFGLVTLLAWSC